ncbi:T9SS type B sorting domain-containing protein [Flavobacterium alkalisoli]|uniref:T9SS type B sorting domain-containing protein n=1 Tax=Flavobacterium alkalisoli TaxID=2602769 RepID=A0A5B9FXX7_9FLAO|nr:gliding motility-associated C-terminal domain-containing protein [Flavobacterium alkalisoli]QEE50826.1 T9SS type B sorting domain-containing protein [Flavobacterium alkalisoli]
MKKNHQPINKQVKLLFAACLLFSIKSLAQLTPTFVNNASATGDGCYTITTNQQSNSGAAWYDNPIDLTQDFDIVFNAYFGSNINGADGMTFVLKTTPDAVIGIIGGGMGYRNLPDQPSLAVEFDTFRNTTTASGEVINDPTYNHIALQKNGNTSHVSPDNLVAPVQASPTSTNIKNGQEHEVKILWRAETQTFTVIFDCSERFSYTSDLVNDVFEGTSTVYFGFTGSTGSLSNNHYICFKYISFLDINLQDYTICSGEQVDTIDANYTGATSYEWSPATGVSDITIPNPVFTPTETTTYTLTITDNCGETIEQEFTIEVSDLSAEINAVNSSVCNGTDAQFTVTGTPDAEVAYTINGGTQETIILDVNGEAVITLPSVTENQLIELVSIALLQAPFCQVDITASASVEVIGEDASFIITPTCSGATATITGDEGGTFAFNPSPVDGAIIDSATGEITNGTPGAVYSVEYTTQGNCSVSSIVEVALFPEVMFNEPEALVECDSNNGFAEFDLSIAASQIQAGNNMAISFYESQVEAETGDASAQLPVTYTNTVANNQVLWVRVEDNTTGCYAITQLELIIEGLPVLNTPNDLYSCNTNADGISIFDLTENEDVIVNNDQYLSVSYFYDNNGTMVGITNPSAFQNTVSGEQLIWVTVENTSGCTASVSFNIYTGQCFIQRGISPNGDGMNDFFDLTGFEVQQLNVYNRYGEKVYSFSHYTNEWGGQSDNGSELPSGTYYYSINFSDPNPTYGSQHTGWIYINRQVN